MAIDVTARTEINRPADEVAAYAFEPMNDPVWIGGITKANLLSLRPVGKGTQVQRLAKFMGKIIDYVLEVETFEPGRLMIMRSIKSPFPMVVTYRFEPIGPDKTDAEIRVQGSPKGFYSFADFLMAPMVRRNITSDIKRLKKILEG